MAAPRKLDSVAHAELDIFEYPAKDTQHPLNANSKLAIGDLHGNSMKLIHFLVRQGKIWQGNSR